MHGRGLRPAPKRRSAAGRRTLRRPPVASSGGWQTLPGARRPTAGGRCVRRHTGDRLAGPPVSRTAWDARRSASGRLAQGARGGARQAVRGDRGLAGGVAVRRGRGRTTGVRPRRERHCGRERLRPRGGCGRSSGRTRRGGGHDRRPRLGCRRHLPGRTRGARRVHCRGGRGGERVAAGSAAAPPPFSPTESADQRACARRGRRRGRRPQRVAHHRPVRGRAGPGGAGGARERPERPQRRGARPDPRRGRASWRPRTIF